MWVLIGAKMHHDDECYSCDLRLCCDRYYLLPYVLDLLNLDLLGMTCNSELAGDAGEIKQLWRVVA